MPGRHPQSASHLRSCPECASALHRERQYLKRLREAPIPPVSEDLAAKLLARTHELAALPPVRQRKHLAGKAAAAKVLAVGTIGTTAAAGILAAGLFAVAGDPYPADRGAASTAMVPAEGQIPAAGAAVDAHVLTGLRAHGWVCPELEAMGFRLESARALLLNGQPAVELKLTDGTHTATITEQRTPAGGALDVPASGPGQDRWTPAPGEGRLRILSTSPWSASYSTPDRTFTVESSLPAERADDALPVLQQAAGQAATAQAATAQAATAQAAKGLTAAVGGSPPAAEEPVAVRLQRGASRIAAVFAP